MPYHYPCAVYDGVRIHHQQRTGASPGFGRARYFFFILGICMSRSDMLRIARGFGGMLPRENFLKRCNLVRFRVYFDQIWSLFFFKIIIFYIYIYIYKKNQYFRYTLAMGYFSCRNFENMLRLMRFGVYFETKMAVVIKK